MGWIELLKKSTEYAKKSIEEITAALRNAGAGRTPSYEPAYSKYRKTRPTNFKFNKPQFNIKFTTKNLPKQTPTLSLTFIKPTFIATTPQITIKSFLPQLKQHKSPFQLLKQVNKPNKQRLTELINTKLMKLPAFEALERESAHSELSSALDFDIKPQFALPLVSELNNSTKSDILEELETHRLRIHQIQTEIERVSEFGELPVTVNNGVLRVHFPNCDTKKLRTLCDEKEIVWGSIVEVCNIHNDAVVDNDNDDVWNTILNQVPALSLSCSTSEQYSLNTY